MTTILGVSALIALLILALNALSVFSYRKGYQRGRRDEAKWLINLEKEVDLERQKIWREE